ncbi:uncharacterized protein [Panulirus ornatus]|uniref:uncharacterized protein n=1 Tax=Panulirus ornatus TaxID=150431 RepID=UPI003A8378D6
MVRRLKLLDDQDNHLQPPLQQQQQQQQQQHSRQHSQQQDVVSTYQQLPMPSSALHTAHTGRAAHHHLDTARTGQAAHHLPDTAHHLLDTTNTSHAFHQVLNTAHTGQAAHQVLTTGQRTLWAPQERCHQRQEPPPTPHASLSLTPHVTYKQTTTSLPHLSHNAVPTTQPAPLPTTQPAPLQTTQPAPLPTTQPAPLPTTQPAPLPTTQPAPLPTTQPAPLPTTQPAPLPTTQPAPLPTTQPAPLPTTQSSGQQLNHSIAQKPNSHLNPPLCQANQFFRQYLDQGLPQKPNQDGFQRPSHSPQDHSNQGRPQQPYHNHQQPNPESPQQHQQEEDMVPREQTPAHHLSSPHLSSPQAQVSTPPSSRPGGSMALYTPPNRGDPRVKQIFDLLPPSGISGWQPASEGDMGGTAPGCPPHPRGWTKWDVGETALGTPHPGGWTQGDVSGTARKEQVSCKMAGETVGQSLTSDDCQKLWEQLMGKQPPQDPPVAHFPQRKPFPGEHNLKVNFPGGSPKLVVWQDEEGVRRLNTEMGHTITAVVSHTASVNASVRFLLVYSKDSETTHPVHPCKNHQKPHQPLHMLEVKAGTAPPSLEERPHPSVIVVPSPSSEGHYSLQLRFLCRNSCITRKGLTLVCQLELQGHVVGRECFKVKISACPKRDANMNHRRPQDQASKRQKTADATHEDQGRAVGVVQADVGVAQANVNMDQADVGVAQANVNMDQADVGVAQANVGMDQASVDVAQTGMGEVLEAARRSAYLSTMDRRFRILHPSDYQSAAQEFSHWWDSQRLH